MEYIVYPVLFVILIIASAFLTAEAIANSEWIMAIAWGGYGLFILIYGIVQFACIRKGK